MSKMVILGRNIEKCRVGYRGKTCKAFGREGGSCRWLPLTGVGGGEGVGCGSHASYMCTCLYTGTWPFCLSVYVFV